GSELVRGASSSKGCFAALGYPLLPYLSIMTRKDMYLYSSKLKQDELESLICTIPLGLHRRLPSPSDDVEMREEPHDFDSLMQGRVASHATLLAAEAIHFPDHTLDEAIMSKLDPIVVRK
nr:hypothetical protein [Tanacetum cinerariifolium]